MASNPGAATTRYVIKTTAGNRGPYTPEQIGRFVEDGKLPAGAKILDLDANRPVTAAEAIVAAAQANTVTVRTRRTPKPASAPALPEPVTVEVSKEAEATEAPAAKAPEATAQKESAEDGYSPQSDVNAGTGSAALERVDENKATPAAPGVKAPTTGSEERRGRRRTPAQMATTRKTAPPRNVTAPIRRPGRAPRSRWRTLAIVGIVAAVVLAAAGVVALTMMKQDRFKDQAATLLADAQAKPDAFGAGADPAFVKVLIKRDHPAALESARLKRGAYEGYKPAFDEARYRAALGEAIAQQVKGPDAVLLTDCAAELVSAEDAKISDVAAAKKLAQQAVTMTHEKDWRSLDALAWSLFKSGDAKRAALIEEQAVELADGEAKSQCGSALWKFKNAH
jgi:hypothetical protein